MICFSFVLRFFTNKVQFKKMKCTILVFSFFFVTLAKSDGEDLYSDITQCGVRGQHDNDFRIINGTLASKGEFPWLISLQIRDGSTSMHICGGAILSKSWIATAAHCLNGIRSSSLFVVAGDYNLQMIEGNEQARAVIKVVTNNFDLPTFSNDIALLKLETPFDFTKNNNIMPICLPKNFQQFVGDGEDLYSDITQCGVRGQHDNDFRIINGTLASKGEFPWLISLQIRDGSTSMHICGGAILSKSWIATAAHCLNGIRSSSLFVVAGDYNLQMIEGNEQARAVIKVVTNNFDLPTFANDIALLKLETPFDFTKNNNIMPICLPKNFQQFVGNAIVAGWGRSSETAAPTNLLHYIEIPLIPKTTCEYNYIRKGFSRLLNACQICAGLLEGGKDACQGDSGGPLVCQDNDKYVLCGIVSWGIGCARPEFPGIYTKVSCFVDWIRNTVLLQ